MRLLSHFAEQRILLKRTINQLAKPNKKHLILFKELEILRDKYLWNAKQIKSQSFPECLENTC